MSFEKVVFSFFILLALTLNFSFVMGDMEGYSNPQYHDPWVLFVAIIANIIATVLKLGDRTPTGAMLLATSLAADLQLIFAAVLWGIMQQVLAIDAATVITNVVALAAGALLANILSVVLLISEAANSQS